MIRDYRGFDLKTDIGDERDRWCPRLRFRRWRSMENGKHGSERPHTVPDSPSDRKRRRKDQVVWFAAKVNPTLIKKEKIP